MTRIVCFYNDISEKEHLEKALSSHDVVFFESPISDHADFSDDEAEILSVFVKSKVDASVMDRMPNLKHIATRSTGFDHIDLEEAKKRGITVSNVPSYGENTVAELAFGLLLMLSRNLYDSYRRVREDGSFSQEGLRGFDLKDKTIGVVGAGHIGRYMISMAKGFGMNVITFDVNVDEEHAKEMGISYVSMEELFSSSDVISFHVPYNEHTHHLLNKDVLKNLKKGVYIINTSRGAVVDTDALVQGLKEGVIAGAGLDVLEEEGPMFDHLEALSDSHPSPEMLKTLLANHYLVEHPKVVITPHNAFNTQEAVGRILSTTVSNIESFVSGNPENIVEAK